jgi:stage II sporulation protein E
MASVVFLIGIVLTAFNPISIYGVKLSGIAAGLVVLYAARFGRESGGAIAGISIGFVMSLADSGSIELAGAYSLGGLLAGLAVPLGAVCSILALVLSVAVYLLRSDISGLLPAIYEMSAASLIYVLTYYKVSSRIGELFSPPTEMPRLDGLRKTVSMRLGFAADALCNVNSTVKKVAERLSGINTPAYEEVFSRVEREACSNCPLNAHCWQNERADTLAALVGLTAEINKKVPSDSLPDLFARKECSRAAVVCNSLERNYREYDSHRVAQQRIDEIRTVIADQFAGMSDMLAEMSTEFERSQKYDRRAAEAVAAVISGMGYRATDIACTVDNFERMTVEIRLDESVGRRINKIELMKKLSVACGRDFAPPAVSSAERNALITFCEQPALNVEYGFAQHCSGRSQMCGDTGEYFLDGRGHAVAILSDGMGTGGRAAVDSAMAAGLLRRLITAGFGYDCSLRIVNSAMLYKSTDETLATVDIASLDLFTGRLNMFKAGAAATVIRRSGRVGKAECSSLPVGILRDIGFDCAEVRLSKGDVVVMMSDGVTDDGTAWVCDMVKRLGIETAQQLAEDIADSARRRRTDGHDDDITVMVMLINEYK